MGAGGEGDGEMGVRVDERASGICREGLILISASAVTLSPASYELMDSVRTDRKPIPLSALQGPSGKLPSLVPYGSGLENRAGSALERQGPVAHLAGMGVGTTLSGETTMSTRPWRKGSRHLGRQHP